MIIMIMFIDRQNEMQALINAVNSKKTELILIYGRRRVGKSRLLIEFAKKHNALYLLADMSKNVLDILASQIREEFVRFKDWEDFFEFMYKSKYKIIIIDEFQYLYNTNKAWPSLLQRWWEKIKETDKKIILCGSIISTIYKISKGYGSALYGRKTMEMNIIPLKFRFIIDFYPNYNFEELINAYAVVGGIPRYLEEFDQSMSIEDNIRTKILNKTSFLYNEPINLLFEEFRDPAPYISIILAITQGYVKFAEIANASLIEGYKLPKYLSVLERVGIIEKDIPVTEKKIKTKITRYKIRDNFYRFWFKFVYRNISTIELGLEDEVFNLIMKDFNAYIGTIFEDVCMEFILDSGVTLPTKIGKWWHKDKEIDIVALNEHTKEILFTECKWAENVNANKILAELREKAQFVDWYNDKRKERYCIIAKSFKTRIPDVLLFDLKDIESSDFVQR